MNYVIMQHADHQGLEDLTPYSMVYAMDRVIISSCLIKFTQVYWSVIKHPE